MTEENKKEFVDKYLNWIFNISIEKQFRSFSKGFNEVTMNGELIKIFTAQDLFLAICGSEILDFDELKRTTRYEDGYDKKSETI